ncbi:TIGR01457 family HAD-type hydrolase [Salsuginibacillus kocurii]|uniref:TIGR01457 family HAD-type hydrolase n=1 Tax=Salsuginibacillus kocurii TaxID=427078 RepID=UPI0003692B2B|nr:TIGR01457 family HAD-type hydrolase [Salsuginibacillus kocurii]
MTNNNVTQYSGYLFDLDGTVYSGKESIQEAISFINALKEKGITYGFITNNSSATREKVAEKLRKMGVEASAGQVFTSALTTAALVKEENISRVYPIGEGGLLGALKQEGIEVTDQQPEAVVVGIDREFSYEKLRISSQALHEGAAYFATNGDKNVPAEHGLQPGNGSIVAAVSAAGGKEPVFVGKPEAHIVNEALERLELDKENVLLIGDNYDTDILAGIHASIDTLLVHTGVTQPHELKQKSKQPTYTAMSLLEWENKLRECR